MAICLILLAPLVAPALAGHVELARLVWLPAYGLDLNLRFDGFGLLFCVLILGIGLLAVLYAYYYLPDSDVLGRSFSLLLLFMAAMLGVVLAEKLILLLAFWENTSLSSFLLVAYRHEHHDARIGARMALAGWRSRPVSCCSATLSAATNCRWCCRPVSVSARTNSTRRH